MMERSEFRKDLYYRLFHKINLPPLRERRDDIPLLIKHFLKRSAQKLKKEIPTVPNELFTLLSNYSFPGNIWELEGMIFDAISRHQAGVLSLDTFYEKISYSTQFGKSIPKDKKVFFGDILPTFTELEALYMKEILERANWNQTKAAMLAGLHRTTFTSRLKKLKEELKRDNEQIFKDVEV